MGFPSGSDGNLPAIWENQVQSLGWKGPLQKGMQHIPVFLPREFQGQSSLAGYSLWGCRVGHDRMTYTHTHTHTHTHTEYVPAL